MATRVLLTVDTELTLRGGERPDDVDDWRPLFARSCEPAGVGLSHQLARLAAHGLKASFFVDPMPALRFGIAPVRAMVAPILAAGQRVELHVHPGWAGDGFELTGLPAKRQRALIGRARDLLIDAGAPPPTAFRAGSYAADAATLEAVAALGLRYDSSHNGAHAPWPSAVPLPADRIAPAALGDVIEVPVSLMRVGSALRPLQLCAISAGEMRHALRHAAATGQPTTAIVSHSFELASRNGKRANRVHIARFEALCRLLAGDRQAMPTVWFDDLADVPVDRADGPVSSPPHLAAARHAAQLWSNLWHERP